jgi:hypothetical protein
VCKTRGIWQEGTLSAKQSREGIFQSGPFEDHLILSAVKTAYNIGPYFQVYLIERLLGIKRELNYDKGQYI